jgi:NAD(P)-dependent dehydrogenase (short-subunit alcohol dehydrogenase family)
MTRVVLVTGANRGIGHELARQLALRGDALVLTARDLAKAERAAAVLPGQRVLARRLDVTDPASIQQVAADLNRRFGRLDVLVNNAAIHYDSWQQASTADLQVVREALEVNLLGAWQTSLTLLPLLRRSGHGRIVNVSSEAGSLATMDGGTPAYTVSKTALNALTRLLAGELRRDRILVNAVCPGWVATDMGGPVDGRWPRAPPASYGPSTCLMTGLPAASTATVARSPGDAHQLRNADPTAPGTQLGRAPWSPTPASSLAQVIIPAVIPPGPTAANQTALNGMSSQPELPGPYWTGLSGRLAVT